MPATQKMSNITSMIGLCVTLLAAVMTDKLNGQPFETNGH